MTANFNVRKYTVPLKEWSSRNNYSNFERRLSWNQLFLETNILLLNELLTQWMIVSSLVKTNTLPFKEWMTAILSGTKTDTLLQEMNFAIRVTKQIDYTFFLYKQRGC